LDVSQQLLGVHIYLLEGRRKPYCVVCSKILASESVMLPNKLERHLTSSHSQFLNKPGSFYFFLNKSHSQFLNKPGSFSFFFKQITFAIFEQTR